MKKAYIIKKSQLKEAFTNARLAQLVEQTAVNRWVAGSSPASGAIL